jgi:hypothetical protein
MDQGSGESEPRVDGLYKTRHLVTDVKRIRLEWLGHVIRMNHTREAKYNVLKISLNVKGKWDGID